MESGRTAPTSQHQSGVARTILAPGGSFALLPEAGQWCPPAYRLYLDMWMEEAASMANAHRGFR